MIILLSTYNQKHFMLYGTLIHVSDKNSIDIMIFNDYPPTYYESKYNIIMEIIQENIKNKNVLLVGSSMSGTIVIKLGLELNLNVISNVPQLNYDITYKHAWDNLKDILKSFNDNNHINISNNYISKYSDTYDKKIIIIHGQHEMDIANIEYLKEELKLVTNNEIIEFVEVNDKGHKWFLSMENENYLSILHVLKNNKR